MPLDQQKLLGLVASGKTQEAIDEIIAQREEIPEELYLEAVTLSSDLAKNAGAQRSGTLSEDVLRVQRNQISQSLIRLSKRWGGRRLKRVGGLRCKSPLKKLGPALLPESYWIPFLLSLPSF